MEELKINNDVVMQEYIVTLSSGEQLRMLLGADTFTPVQKFLDMIHDVEGVCNYGSKMLTVVGS